MEINFHMKEVFDTLKRVRVKEMTFNVILVDGHKSNQRNLL